MVSMVLAILIACRVLFLILLPLADSWESRYAEMARKMVETGDWITPQFDYGIPFWASPPLAMWISALGIELFGANEFGSRIFIFLAALAILSIVAAAVRRELDATSGLVAATLLMGMPLFYYCSAAVMTDLVLVLGTTMAMVGFRSSVLMDSRRWGYVFFVGLAIGLLAKGPLVLVLAIPPIVGWMCFRGQWKRSWKSLPWISGTLLMFALALPWYFVAERRTPGFLDYFIVGEHWKRFLTSGWKGGLYGNEHSENPGMIWIYWLMLTFPWCLGLLALPFRKWRLAGKWAIEGDGRGLYFALWAIWPLVFFSLCRNVIATYPLPALPALAILLGEIASLRTVECFAWKRFHPLHPALVTVSIGSILVAGIASCWQPGSAPKRTERNLVRIFHEQSRDGDHLLYFGKRRYSAEFYSEGEVLRTESSDVLSANIESPGRLFVAMSSPMMDHLPPPLRRRFLPVTHWQGNRTNLFVERNDTPDLVGIDPFRTHPIGK